MKSNSLIIFTNFPFPHLGGLSRCISDEVTFFSGRGYNVFLIYAPSEMPLNFKLRPNVTLVPQQSSMKKAQTVVNRIRRASLTRKIALKNNVQCIYTHDIYSAFICILASLGKRTVLHTHSIFSEDRFKMGKPFHELSTRNKITSLLGYLLDSTVEFLVYNLVHSIICTAEYQLEGVLKKSLSKKRASVLWNGINTKTFKPRVRERRMLRRKLRIPDGKIVCMFLGRMVPKNGPLIIARAIPIINQKTSKALFVFVGDGVEKEKIRKYVENQKLRNVMLLKGTPAEKILPIADVFVTNVSPIWEKTLDRTIFEAMASGIPTIIGRDPHKEDIFDGGKELLFVRKGDPKAIAERILQLMSDEKKIRTLSINGRKRVVKDFSLDTFMDSLEGIANSINA